MIIWIIIVAVFLIAILVIKDKKKETQTDNAQLIQNSENTQNNSEKINSDNKLFNNPNFIYPKPFRASSLLLPSKPYYSMNNCDHSVLYPINALDVNYGSKFPDCRCTEYVQAP